MESETVVMNWAVILAAFSASAEDFSLILLNKKDAASRHNGIGDGRRN